MEPPISSSLVLQKSRAGLEVKSVHRSPQACLYCRSRKVRCDVSKNGQPCMNCNLDEQKCVVTKRASRRDDADPPEPKIQLSRQLPTLTYIPRNLKLVSNPTTTAQAPSVPQTKMILQQREVLKLNCSARHMAHPRRHLWVSSLPLTVPRPERHSDNRLEPSNTVVYCSYPFMAVSNMFYVPAQDVRFLDAEECFRLPIRSILDQAIRQYFLHVHPLLPMLSEADFWEAYYSPAPEEATKTSLLLMQAMLFVSCNFLSLDSINRLGYNNVRSARASFYRKAKLIYDFGIESCHLTTARAALLLTFWTPPLKADSKPNTSWLMIAIENARTVKADYHSDVSNFPSQKADDHAILRRLWWCCIMRDRILPLGLRRSIIITPAHFDFNKNLELGTAELQAEIRRSNVFDAETKSALATVIKRLLKFSVLMTDVLLLLYPLKPVAENPREMEVNITSVGKYKDDLLRWYKDGSTSGSARREKIVEHKSVTMHTTLMYIYYHGAVISLCHCDLKGAVAAPNCSQRNKIAQTRKDVQHSISSITDLLDRLNQLHVARWLPITIVAYAAFPLAAHIFDAQFPRAKVGNSAEQQEHSKSKQRQLTALIKAMKVFHEQYDGVEDVVRTIRNIIHHIQVHVEISSSQTTRPPLTESPNWDLLLSLAIDWSLSTGKSPDGQDFSKYLQGLFKQSITSSSSASFGVFSSGTVHKVQCSTKPDSKDRALNFGIGTPSSPDDEFENYHFIDSSLLSNSSLGDENMHNGLGATMSPSEDSSNVLASVWDGMMLDAFVGAEGVPEGPMTWGLHGSCDGHDQMDVRTGQLLNVPPEGEYSDSLDSPFIMSQ
ncbi:fungal-specific transcription factor domain-containing protein [Dactylonectria macrodidyma]|uniref:Fungal-specific transcription factor domain-containing protein n=1 Tax=Dactylonectria macrodidyma TaxID=307937 RepID=A0A9P9FHJ6_9HYPO|nr:fungal-specific transcription factor domain-containing protein [Dactylonectria macrodidyma]